MDHVALIINARNRSDLRRLPWGVGEVAVRIPMWITETLLLSWYPATFKVDDPVSIDFGATQVLVTTIGTPMTPRLIECLQALKLRRLVKRSISRAVSDEVHQGAAIYVLTGHTGASDVGETVINDCRKFSALGCTGNGTTAFVSSQATLQECRRMGIAPHAATLAVVGGYGSIGRAYIGLCGPHFKEVLAIGPPNERLSLRRLFRRQRGRAITAQAKMERLIRDAGQQGVAIRAAKLEELAHADVIATTSRTHKPIIYPSHVATAKPVLLMDVSVPKAVDDTVAAERPNAHVIEGGAVQVRDAHGSVVPCPFDFTPGGEWPACAVEGLLLALSENSELATQKAIINLQHATDLGSFLQEHANHFVIEAKERVPTLHQSAWKLPQPIKALGEGMSTLILRR